jgi:hypothetical protein
MDKRRLGAWLALLALALQIGFSTAHSAWHFDHLVGHLAPFSGTDNEVAAHGITPGDPRNLPPGSPAPKTPDLDHCAIGLGLLASANFIAAGSTPLAIPTDAGHIHLEATSAPSAPAVPQHVRPPPRAPPLIGISA